MPLFRRASKLSDEDYQKAIDKGLDRAFGDTQPEVQEIEITDLRAVVFSDHHRGARDRADDFMKCERAYRAALGWYFEQDYALWLLGDVEELWENGVNEILPEYTEVLELEKQFATGPGLRRFYGNHDLDWRDPKRVADHLANWLPDVGVREALRLGVVERSEPVGLLFLVHGHQGTSFSDRWAKVSRLGLRYGWRLIQRATGWLSTTPAEDHELRHKHDIAMSNWARDRVLNGEDGERPVMIAGHTHHPVFPGKPPKHPGSADAQRILQQLEQERDEEKRRTLQARLQWIRALMREDQYVPPQTDPPCYFNSGCCCFPDRDVTCIEINGEPLVDTDMRDEQDGRGKIRLMRFLNDAGEPMPKQLAALPLREVFARVAAA
jgi:UDP-2,3-diacylglucosamine pyrophosphatase LpxH